MSKTIEIYPMVPKPDWVKPLVQCHVLGEADDVFTISQVLENRVVLINSTGRTHGAESFTKLRQVMMKPTPPPGYTLLELGDKIGYHDICFSSNSNTWVFTPIYNVAYAQESIFYARYEGRKDAFD